MFEAVGRMFAQYNLRCIAMTPAAHQGTNLGGEKYVKGIMEHKVIEDLNAVNGGRTIFRHWHQKFTTALCQMKMEYRGWCATW